MNYLDGMLDFISNSHKEKASFSTVNSNLPNQLIKALSVKFLSDWANACFSCLSLLQFFIKITLKLKDICSSSRSSTDTLNPKLLLIHGIFSWRKNTVKYILSLCICDAVGRLSFLFVKQVSFSAGWNKHCTCILYQWVWCCDVWRRLHF